MRKLAFLAGLGTVLVFSANPTLAQSSGLFDGSVAGLRAPVTRPAKQAESQTDNTAGQVEQRGIVDPAPKSPDRTASANGAADTSTSAAGPTAGANGSASSSSAVTTADNTAKSAMGTANGAVSSAEGAADNVAGAASNTANKINPSASASVPANGPAR